MKARARGMSMSFHIEHLDSPTGRILLVTDETQCLRALDWEDHEARMRQLLLRHYGEIRLEPRPTRRASEARDALLAYFDGRLQAIDRVQTATRGSAFQRQVWSALRGIPAGTTSSYAALAACIGRPSAARAVGAANGANPIAIIVPCHRVIGADAALTGYGGGLARKRWLLAHESAAPPDWTSTIDACRLAALPSSRRGASVHADSFAATPQPARHRHRR